MSDHQQDAPIVSADSHVLEPGDLWTRSIGQRFGDALPRIVKGFEGHEGTFFYLGRPGEAARTVEQRLDEEQAPAVTDAVEGGLQRQRATLGGSWVRHARRW